MLNFQNLFKLALILTQFSSVQSLSHVRLFATPWTAAYQASLFITNSQSLLKLMSIESVMPSNHLILCCPFLLTPSIFPSIRVFSNESALHIRRPESWSFRDGAWLSRAAGRLSHPSLQGSPCGSHTTSICFKICDK